MPYCPKCKENFERDISNCPNCNFEFENNSDSSSKEDWVIVGRIMDKTSADYAIESLESYQIPAVVFSESGFFGQAGLKLPSVTGKGLGQFQIKVPDSYIEEAVGILDMILGENWEKEERNQEHK